MVFRFTNKRANRVCISVEIRGNFGKTSHKKEPTRSPLMASTRTHDIVVN